LGNFLGVAGGAGAGAIAGGGLANRPSTPPADRLGAGLANRPSTLPAERPGAGIGNRPGTGVDRPSQRPSERPNWGDWSEGRDDRWNDRVNDRHDAWNDWQDNSQQRRDDFQQNRDNRWNDIENARNDRQDWRSDNREDWQNHREDMWEYRGDRCEEIWDNARDFYDDVFDDRWWGACGWYRPYGIGWGGVYARNPWWWWAPVTIGAVAGFVDAIIPDPVYIDYGTTVVYQGDTVYVNQQPMPVKEYTEPIINLAVTVEQPPPPLPPEEGEPVEWMPLGVFALAQEEKGDPVMLFQLSINKEGVISGGSESTLTGDQKTVAGSVNKQTQDVAWRLGENKETVYATSLGNLTRDVSPITIHFGDGQIQTWLLVRLPPPTEAETEAAIPAVDRNPPPAGALPTAKSPGQPVPPPPPAAKTN
jgi:hypothetical protein